MAHAEEGGSKTHSQVLWCHLWRERREGGEMREGRKKKRGWRGGRGEGRENNEVEREHSIEIE